MDALQCYICYEEGSDTKPLALDPPPCDCKGSIAIHKACLQEVLVKNVFVCSACNKHYSEKYFPGYDKDAIYEIDNDGYKLKYYVNDRFEKHGLYQKICKSGNLYIQANYENGKLHGLYEEFYSGNEIRTRIQYFHGKTHGPVKRYIFGKLFMVERIICDGIKIQTHYNKNNGSIMIYKEVDCNDSMNGMYQSWDINGNLEKNLAGYYRNGEKVKDLEVIGKGVGCTIM
jgi:antitoxin component YwqK of YwqJK toxin-antitoxin module